MSLASMDMLPTSQEATLPPQSTGTSQTITIGISLTCYFEIGLELALHVLNCFGKVSVTIDGIQLRKKCISSLVIFIQLSAEPQNPVIC